MTIHEIVLKFISKKNNYRGFDKSTVSNLLLGNSKSVSTFIEEMGDFFEAEAIDNEIYVHAVRETVKSYTSNKQSAISIFKMLTEYIEKELCCKIQIDFPPIPISNTFERLMFISKYFHDPKNTVGELEDILWVSDRTIEKDIAKLRGNDDDPIQICGKQFIIDDTVRTMGHLQFESTVHPFFLTCNLTQVVATLKGLAELSKQPEWKGYTQSLSRNIWDQLSDYGKERVKYVMTKLMPEDMSIVQELEDKSYDAFFSEADCSALGDNGLLMSMKNEKPAYVEYRSANGTVFYENVRFINYVDDGYRVTINGEERILEADKIIRSTVNKEKMF